MNPKITIITINYNNREGLEKTIKNVISQSYKDFEYIVIDGGSQDGSKEVIESFADKISYWVSEPDKGIYNAMNKGIGKANGEYLLFLNSGDKLFNNDSLVNTLPYLEKEDIVYGDLEVIGDKESYIKKYTDQLSFHYFYIESLPHPATFIRKTAFERFGDYDESFKIISDWKWFLEAIIFKKATCKHVPLIISSFYLDGISSVNTEKIKQEKIKVLNKYVFHTVDAEKIEELREKIKQLEQFENKIQLLKKSKWLKISSKLGLFKGYKYL